MPWSGAFLVAAAVALQIVRPQWADRLSWGPWVAGAVVAVSASWISLKRNVAESVAYFLLSLAGAWTGVPDTEAISVLLGVAAVVALATRRSGQFGRWTGTLAAALVTLVLTAEAGAREEALVGSFGAMAVAGLPGSGPISLARHAILVALWARVAGRMSTGVAALFTGLAFTAGLWGLEALIRRRRMPPVSGR